MRYGVLDQHITTVETECDAFDGSRLFDLKDTLCLVANPEELQGLVKGGYSEQIHIGCPRGHCNLRRHQLLQLDQKLVALFFLHQIQISKSYTTQVPSNHLFTIQLFSIVVTFTVIFILPTLYEHGNIYLSLPISSFPLHHAVQSWSAIQTILIRTYLFFLIHNSKHAVKHFADLLLLNLQFLHFRLPLLTSIFCPLFLPDKLYQIPTCFIFQFLRRIPSLEQERFGILGFKFAQIRICA